VEVLVQEVDVAEIDGSGLLPDNGRASADAGYARLFGSLSVA
jgi:hypothetical protein